MLRKKLDQIWVLPNHDGTCDPVPPSPPPPSVVCKLSATATSEEETLNSQQIEEAVRAEGLTAPALQNLFCLSHCLRYALQMCVWASVFVQQVGLLVFSHPRRINPAVTGMYLVFPHQIACLET